MVETPNKPLPPKSDPSTEDLSRQIDTLKKDISRLTELVGNYGKSRGERLRVDAEARAAAFKDDAQGRIEDVETYVRQNPATALGIAAAVGFVLGLMRR
ncbi:DUF883 family protein [Palleronia sediminis]|uniref:DUF883 family protein n=1 Tax=Palleronia sediminis TaxID=2547833 RepID=A0A4R6A995_9RHOB|nr:DUF883 family protein [Palleronia sediminis]TDL79382.1 DUF883 family protein [Palleronia sediminis]